MSNFTANATRPVLVKGAQKCPPICVKFPPTPSSPVGISAPAASSAWRSIRRVDTRDARILLLHAWEGLMYRAIAAVLEVPAGTVMSRLYAARQRLRRELGDDDAV